MQSTDALPSAAMPVIKLNARSSSGGTVRMDVSFDAPSHRYGCNRTCACFTSPHYLTGCCDPCRCGVTARGLVTAALVLRLLRDFPVLKPLTLVLKQLLVEKGLNDAYTGGLSSYGLVLLIASLLTHSLCVGVGAVQVVMVLLCPNSVVVGVSCCRCRHAQRRGTSWCCGWQPGQVNTGVWQPAGGTVHCMLGNVWRTVRPACGRLCVGDARVRLM